MSDRTAASRVAFEVEASALPRGIVASSAAVEEDLDFLVLPEPLEEEVPALRLEPLEAAAFDDDAAAIVLFAA